jgi:hypothetical protein
MAIWYNEWPFGVVCGSLVYFPHFGMFGSRKSGNPAQNQQKLENGLTPIPPSVYVGMLLLLCTKRGRCKAPGLRPRKGSPLRHRVLKRSD